MIASMESGAGERSAIRSLVGGRSCVFSSNRVAASRYDRLHRAASARSAHWPQHRVYDPSARSGSSRATSRDDHILDHRRQARRRRRAAGRHCGHGRHAVLCVRATAIRDAFLARLGLCRLPPCHSLRAESELVAQNRSGCSKGWAAASTRTRSARWTSHYVRIPSARSYLRVWARALTSLPARSPSASRLESMLSRLGNSIGSIASPSSSASSRGLPYASIPTSTRESPAYLLPD